MLAIVILAAGKGTRMNSDLPKVLHRLHGKPLIAHVMDTARALQPDRLIVIVGHRREEVVAEVKAEAAEWVVQEPQLGTGHAVLQTAEALNGFDGDVVVLSGDVPLLRAATLRRLIEAHRASVASATVLSAVAENPASYGRIVRDAEGQFEQIVEEREATPDERAIQEVNSGVYCFAAQDLFPALRNVRAVNSKGEFYLTDVIGILRKAGRTVQCVDYATFTEIRGINTPRELAEAEAGLGAAGSGVGY